jgi:hypothetical protein
MIPPPFDPPPRCDKSPSGWTSIPPAPENLPHSKRWSTFYQISDIYFPWLRQPKGCRPFETEGDFRSPVNYFSIWLFSPAEATREGSVQAGLSSLRKFAKRTEHRAAPSGAYALKNILERGGYFPLPSTLPLVAIGRNRGQASVPVCSGF